jgi:uncharacterized protein involved in exopolysaccharide biosynthesis
VKELSELPKKQDISLSELITAILSGKIKIIVGTIIFALISVAIALYLPNQYKSKSTLIVNSESSGGLASLAGSLGGLAGMAGINLGGGQENSNPLIAKELIKSQAFILKFIDKHDLLVPIMASKKWDEATNTLIIDTKRYDVNKGLWLFKDTPSKQDRPKQEDIVKEFKKIFTLNEDTKNGIITMSVEFYSPELSQQWLNFLIIDINETIRQYDVEQSTKSINYLKGLLIETENAAFQETFYNLIEEQTKTLMLSKVRDDYVFKTIDPPNLPEKKSKPSRAFICVLGSFFGGFLMTLWVLIGYFIKR